MKKLLSKLKACFELRKKILELRKKILELNKIIEKQTLDYGELAYVFYKLRGEKARKLKESQANIKWLRDNLVSRNSQVIKKDFQIQGLIKAIKKERAKNGK